MNPIQTESLEMEKGLGSLAMKLEEKCGRVLITGLKSYTGLSWIFHMAILQSIKKVIAHVRFVGERNTYRLEGKRPLTAYLSTTSTERTILEECCVNSVIRS